MDKILKKIALGSSLILLGLILVLARPEFPPNSATNPTTNSTTNQISNRTNTVTYIVALDGSGNFTDIQSAINAIPPALKGVVVIKAGIYDLNPTMKYPLNSLILRSNLTLIGAGVDRTVIRGLPNRQPAGSDVRAPTVTSLDGLRNVVIENLTVTQNGTPDNKGYGAIDLRGGPNENIVIRNVKVTYAYGAAIGIRQVNNALIQNCTIKSAWTGITLLGGSNALIKGNRIANTVGDGIFPQTIRSGGMSVTNVTIEDNYLENIGDTGIDITSLRSASPHVNITARRNTLKNAHIRVSYAEHITIAENDIEDGFIIVDSGAGRPIDVTVEGNRINTSSSVGIGFYGAQDSSALNNDICMRPPAKGTIQTGISAGIFGTGRIEGNLILNASGYGIDFAGYGLSEEGEISIRNNTMIDFGVIGIWDNGLDQGTVLVENNAIWDRHQPFVSMYGIRTSYTANAWTIRYNHVYAGKIATVSAPGSRVYENTYLPP